MQDNAFIGALFLVIRPFTEDLDGIWKYLKGVCLASLIVAVCVWFFSFIASAEDFATAKRVLNLTGWFMFIIFVFSYLALYVEIFYAEKEKKERRDKNIRGFH